jgi:hypothetical protein
VDVSTSPNPQVGGPPLVSYPRLLIPYIRRYPPYWRPFLHPQPEDAPCRGDRDPLITARGCNSTPIIRLNGVVRDKVAFFTSFASTLFAFHIERALIDCHAFVWHNAGCVCLPSWYCSSINCSWPSLTFRNLNLIPLLRRK